MLTKSFANKPQGFCISCKQTQPLKGAKRLQSGVYRCYNCIQQKALNEKVRTSQ